VRYADVVRQRRQIAESLNELIEFRSPRHDQSVAVARYGPREHAFVHHRVAQHEVRLERAGATIGQVSQQPHAVQAALRLTDHAGRLFQNLIVILLEQPHIVQIAGEAIAARRQKRRPQKVPLRLVVVALPQVRACHDVGARGVRPILVQQALGDLSRAGVVPGIELVRGLRVGLGQLVVAPLGCGRYGQR
jgi:hypothetical protein